MRTIILVLVLGLISLDAQPQQGESKTLEQLKSKIDSLQVTLSEKNYYRVPAGEIDKSLSTVVSNEVYSSIYRWIGFLALLIGVVGFLVGAYAKGQIKDRVEEQVKTKFESLTLELARVETALKNENENQNQKLADIEMKIETLIKDQKNFIQSTAAEVDDRINNVLNMIWNDIAEGINSRAAVKNYNSQDLISEIKTFLENKSVQISEEKKILLIDSLMRCYYHTIDAKTGDYNYKKMIELLKKYENDFELLPETYANAAIALNNNYERYGIKDDHDACIECCDKSISRLKDYGIPYALKLEVYVMEYIKAFDAVERAKAQENILRVFKSIENNNSHILCIEIYDRLETDRQVAYLKEYIDRLDKLFPNELYELKQRACSDIISNENLKNSEKYVNLFNTVLEDGLNKSPNLDGNWRPVKIVQNGVELGESEFSFSLELKDYNFLIQRTGYLDKGLVHFIPFSTIAGVNFYSQEGNNANRITKAIYKIENDQLITCVNYNTDKRPDDFTSTPENKFYLVYYNKVSAPMP